MKTTPAIFLFILLITLFACGEQKGSRSSVEKPSISVEIPALFERQGALASATEWPKTREKVEELTTKIREKPGDVKPRLQLAVIYLSEARITGEHPYYYPAVLKILDDVLVIEPKNFEATTFKASVKMSQHRFGDARQLAQQAQQINPDNAYVYGVLVDANVELGNYSEAVAMSDKMQALKPSLEAYSRVSYLREIYGNYPGAIEAMKLAVEAGLPGSEPQCWAKSTLGHLYETTGQVKQAEVQYREILAMRPSYAFALRGLAQVHKANKQYDQALAELEKAAEIMPEFSFHEEMADIYALQGKKEKAAGKYREVVKMLGEDARSGHTVDLELCKLYTKTGQLDSAIVYGLKEYAKRPGNIDVNHALAHAYFRDGNNIKAQQHVQAALRTDNKDPQLLQVAGSIEMAMGNKVQGNRLLVQAKKTNPRFVL